MSGISSGNIKACKKYSSHIVIVARIGIKYAVKIYASAYMLICLLPNSHMLFCPVYLLPSFVLTFDWHHLHRELLHLVDFCHRRQMGLEPALEVGPKVEFEELGQLYSDFSDFLACFSHSE